MINGSERQKLHYNRINDIYDQHYFDQTSISFRRQFIYTTLFDGLDCNNKVVADLASGSGYNTLALLEHFPRAKVYGFDISEKACENYQRITGCPAYTVDLTTDINVDMQVDVAMIFGGLHHCISNLPNTLKTVSKLLKPGGIFLMYEPNSHYFLENIRKLWYRADKYFDQATEHALAHDKIAQMASEWFKPLTCIYKGGPAYFLIYNSLLFRIPLPLKKWIAPPLFIIEKIYNRLPGKYWYPYFMAKWQRNNI